MNAIPSTPQSQLTANALRFDLSLTEVQISLGAELANIQLATAALHEFSGSETEIETVHSLRFKTADISEALSDKTKERNVTQNDLEVVQDKYGCFVSLFSDLQLASGGMPIAVKDVFAFGEHQPTAGLTAPPTDLSIGKTNIIGRLQEAGAVIVGTTKCSPWCYVPTEQNEYVSPPVNPLGENLLVGGSSSGSAVAVAS